VKRYNATPVMLSEAPAKPWLYAKAGNISDLSFPGTAEETNRDSSVSLS
jgi:hypothetical protein